LPAQPKLRILMICTHEPRMDPRVCWEAGGASARFEVTVLGFARDGQEGNIEHTGSHGLILLPRADRSAVGYFWRLREVMPAALRILFTVLLVLMSPPLAFADQAARFTALVVHRAMGRAAASIDQPLSASRTVLLLGAIRGGLFARIYCVLSSVRHRFSPAAVGFWELIQNMLEKPDTIHCNDLDTLLVGVLAKKRYGCRLIYDAHEFYPHSDPSGRWLDITVFSALERSLIRHADAVVTVNPPLADAMREAYGLAEVHAVANAEPWTGPRTRPVGTRMDQLAAGRCKFLFQGRFTPGRGIDELITAWAKIDSTRAALFLRGPDNMWRRDAMTLASELGLLDYDIYFLDAVTEDQLIAAAAEADVGVIPYRPLIINDRLCCPNKLSQYLHAGLMVVANELPFVKSLLAEAQAGLIYDSARPDSFVEVVRRIVDNPELLRRSRQNALRFARERFNWQIEGEKLYRLYYRPEQGKVLPEPIIAPAPQ
jgi:glycosyltransferase involved in cell wall biosynthesis